MNGKRVRRDPATLRGATDCWQALSRFRRERERCKQYTFGNQWCDRITVDGVRMTEEDYIIREGNIPLKNNLIRRLVRNITGVFRERLPELVKGWDKETRERAERHSMAELYGRSLEEFLISGMAVHRKCLTETAGERDVATEIVDPDSFFFDTGARDPRGNDMRIVGQMHDLDFATYCRNFVRSREDYERAQGEYGFQSRIRVAEVWRRELCERVYIHDERGASVRIVTAPVGRSLSTREREAGEWRLEEAWRYRYITESGEVLREGVSPFGHGGHPYVFKFYPFLDGEIHSFVDDIIDQQRYANRLITLYDWVMRASAKGVLLFPEDSLPTKGNLDEIADEWSRFNGVITYKSRPGVAPPAQVNSTTANSGISELLNIQLRMMEDVSGVHGALQGKSASGGVSGSLYSQQKESSLTSLRDILETYESFIRNAVDLEKKLLQK